MERSASAGDDTQQSPKSKGSEDVGTEDEGIPTIEELIKRVEEFVEQDVRNIEDLVLPEDDLEKFPEPQITSSDPYERRVARRLRIRNKFRERRRIEETRIK